MVVYGSYLDPESTILLKNKNKAIGGNMNPECPFYFCVCLKCSIIKCFLRNNPISTKERIIEKNIYKYV